MATVALASTLAGDIEEEVRRQVAGALAIVAGSLPSSSEDLVNQLKR